MSFDLIPRETGNASPGTESEDHPFLSSSSEGLQNKPSVGDWAGLKATMCLGEDCGRRIGKLTCKGHWVFKPW